MEQRRPRLGDVVDDYCPRERRLTNHAIVAMLDDAIKQTRCTTCDAEHEYKGARVPAARRKRETTGALYEQVLAAATDRPLVRRMPDPGSPPVSEAGAEAPAEAPTPDEIEREPVEAGNGMPETAGEAAPDDTRIRRALIRATLPRTDTQPATRPIPEFTIRTSGRGGAFRSFDGRQARSGADGNRAGHPHAQGRPSGSQPGRSQKSHAHPTGQRKSSRRGKKRSR